MNRLILIGNGFDLAHGMKTSYNDFILWYLKKCFNEAYEKGKYEDKLLEITKRTEIWVGDIKDVEGLINYFYNDNIIELINTPTFRIPKAAEYAQYFTNPFSAKISSELLEQLLLKCSNSKWVDIENEFYQQLKEILAKGSEKKLKSLNDSLSFIIEQLGFYLEQLDQPELIHDYLKIFNSSIYKSELCIKIIEVDEKANDTLVLNFNYTNTPEKYFENEIGNFNVNYIHGTIDNSKSMVFGFGDELDDDYKKLELQKANAFFEYIKSFWYFKNSKYHNLVRFIDGEEFQVYILGHSCGLSDRTMLNMIFEHENCKSIKIFYHGTKEKNNFTNLTQEISRHFKDKAMMRKKIVPFDKSEPMPNVE